MLHRGKEAHLGPLLIGGLAAGLGVATPRRGGGGGRSRSAFWRRAAELAMSSCGVCTFAPESGPAGLYDDGPEARDRRSLRSEPSLEANDILRERTRRQC